MAPISLEIEILDYFQIMSFEWITNLSNISNNYICLITSNDYGPKFWKKETVNQKKKDSTFFGKFQKLLNS